MYWSVFNTAWGWAAVYGEGNTLESSLLPAATVERILEQIAKTGQEARFIADDDNSHPVVNDYRAYYQGKVISDWNINLKLDHLPSFTRQVLQYVYTIPYGETSTYSEVAIVLGNPRASQAVGQALRHNPIPLIIPCHRVLAVNNPGGFSAPGGIETKLKMLAWERKHLK